MSLPRTTLSGGCLPESRFPAGQPHRHRHGGKFSPGFTKRFEGFFQCPDMPVLPEIALTYRPRAKTVSVAPGALPSPNRKSARGCLGTGRLSSSNTRRPARCPGDIPTGMVKNCRVFLSRKDPPCHLQRDVRAQQRIQIVFITGMRSHQAPRRRTTPARVRADVLNYKHISIPLPPSSANSIFPPLHIILRDYFLSPLPALRLRPRCSLYP